MRSVSMSGRNLSDDSASQRKRIAVACVRCRKRKIRCSGDNGTGEQCTNCKNAGHVPCQFLRVSSQETAMKTEGFTYNLDLARQFQARAPPVAPPMVPPMNPYQETIPMASAEPLPYRNSTAYAYNGKQCYTLPNWSEYSEDQTVDYSMYQPTYQTIPESSYAIPYRMGASSSANKSATPIYISADTAYGYSSVPTPTALPHRPVPTPDVGNFSLQNVATGLSSVLSNRERGQHVPPVPTLPSSEPTAYRNDTAPLPYVKPSPSPTPTGTHPPTALVNAATPYSAHDSIPLPSYAVTTAPPSIGRSANDLYTAASSTEIAGGEITRPSSTGPLRTYHYEDTTRRVNGSVPSTAHITLGSGSPFLSRSPIERKPKLTSTVKEETEIEPESALIHRKPTTPIHI